MPRRSLVKAATAACALALLFTPPAAMAGQQDDGDFFLGVQTHFVQGWRLEYLDLFEQLSATVLRDELSWSEVEQTPGEHDFSRGRTQFLSAAIGMGLDPLILFADTNPLYDDGQTPFSAEGQAAFAAYVAAMLDRFAPDVRRIEIGNEFNSDDFVSGPFADDRARHFTGLLRAVHEAVKATHPETEILCTGTHSVAMGFFRDLFEHGALAYCDAISLHPYREYPEGLDVELARLRGLMAEYGPVLPIHVTEFGKWFDDPDEAPDFMLKMVAVMGDAGVAGAWWYALLDQPWWPNMGLYLPDDRQPMPAADSFRLLQETLLPLGRPRRLMAAPTDHVYAFGSGTDAVVAWGAPGRLEVEGANRFLDARGTPIDRPDELGDAPVVILGQDLDVRVLREREIVDLRYGFGHPPWSYHALRPDGTMTELEYIDWEWSPFLGDPHLRPLLVTREWISGVYFDSGPFHAVERFTAPRDGSYQVTGRWLRSDDDPQDGADIRISLNGAPLATGLVIDDDFTFGPQEITLEAGDRLDFAVGPNVAFGGDAVQREISILLPPETAGAAQP